jgi:hypothetical protein
VDVITIQCNEKKKPVDETEERKCVRDSRDNITQELYDWKIDLATYDH